MRKKFALAAIVALLTAGALAGTATIQIQADQPAHRIPASLWGIFFEEISSAGDGGLYAELVRNRSFEEPIRTNYWQPEFTGGAAGQMEADNSLPLTASNQWSLRLTQASAGGTVGAFNPGYWGMNLSAGQTYDLTLWARASGGFNGPLTVRLENSTGSQVLAQDTINGLTTGWQRFALALMPSATSTNGRLQLRLSGAGTVWVDMVSLFPRATFQGRTNGLRADLAEMLVDLRPSFVRFPGGSWVNGIAITNAYRWKNTIGDLGDRPHQWNLWGYQVSHGLGYHEYLQMSEDLNADALFVINSGMSVFSNLETVPLNEMGPWVQDALDAIEYAIGPTNSTWGAMRAANGRPEPFNLKYIQIGNEDGGSAYNNRYALFYDAIKAAYPDLRIVACNWGGLPTSRPVEISDEHYYNNPAFFINNANRYNTYSRSGPEIYVGEYAVTSGNGNGNLLGALAEAAFMTGLERNSDIVTMATYAPLFANLNNKNWNPDLIYFDSARVCGTPSYYVQQMFAQHRGDVLLPVNLTVDLDPAASQLPRGNIGVGSWNTSVQYSNLVVLSNGVTLYQSDFTGGAAEWQVYNGTWSTSAGVYQPTALITDCRSATGDTDWANYTITLRARKVSGSEGFLILFHRRDDANYTWWNLGGWNNTRHAIEHSVNGSKSILGAQVAGSIQTGQWYDLRIELHDRRIRCYLEEVLIHDVSYPAPKQGAIGLGTWNTSASFTNVVVTGNSQTLYQSDFSAGASEWTVYNGTWSTLEGRYRQTSTSTTDCRSTTGSTNWSDYTLSLRARKDAGSEGFLIIFNWQDDNNFTWWNLGGWNNTRHAIEVAVNGTKSELGGSVPGSIVTGQWYDVRVELAGTRIRCYLDNVLLHDVDYVGTGALFATAAFDEATGQIILKAVNVTDQNLAGAINLPGVAGITPEASRLLLTSASPTDENTLAQPTRVAPVGSVITNTAVSFTNDFPPYSLTVLRLQTPPAVPARLRFDAGTNQNDSASLSNGVPVRLASFITNTVLVAYTIEAADGTTVVTGGLTFQPGDLTKFIPLPAGEFLRVTLHDPVGAVIDDPTRVYVAGAPLPGAPLRLEFAWFADETLIYWTDATAQLLHTSALPGGWTDATGVFIPFRLPLENGQTTFYRLCR